MKVDIEFIADTGAIYTVIPKSIADKLELEEVDRRSFKIVGDEIVEYPISEAYMIIGCRGATSIVAIGPDKTPPLLGVVALELLGLQVVPVTGELKPLELMIL